MTKVNIVDENKEYYYEQFVRDFQTLPRIIRNACGNSLVLPLLFKQIRREYEFIRDAQNIYEYQLVSNGNVVAQMDEMGFQKLSLPELRFYKDNNLDYVLSTNWMGGLTCIDLPNLETSADGFLRYTFGLKEVHAPKWRSAGNFTLFCKAGLLSVLDAPCLRKAGQHCNPLVYATMKKNTIKQK